MRALCQEVWNHQRLFIGAVAFLVETIGWGALVTSRGIAGIVTGVALVVLGFFIWGAMPEAESPRTRDRHEILK